MEGRVDLVIGYRAAWYCRLSVRPSISAAVHCGLTKRYILQEKCLNRPK